jgi:hypothetical protein
MFLYKYHLKSSNNMLFIIVNANYDNYDVFFILIGIKQENTTY